MPHCGCDENLLFLRQQEKRRRFLGWRSHIPNLVRIDVFGSHAEERPIMPWWLGGIAVSARRQLQKARSFEREQGRRLNYAYARGYKKYRQRQKQSERRER